MLIKWLNCALLSHDITDATGLTLVWCYHLLHWKFKFPKAVQLSLFSKHSVLLRPDTWVTQDSNLGTQWEDIEGSKMPVGFISDPEMIWACYFKPRCWRFPHIWWNLFICLSSESDIFIHSFMQIPQISSHWMAAKDFNNYSYVTSFTDAMAGKSYKEHKTNKDWM